MKDEAEPPRDEITGVSLRLRHPQPRDLGGMLRNWGRDVGREWRAGDPRVTPKGGSLEGVWRDSYAYTNLDFPASGTLPMVLSKIMDELGPIRADLQAFANDGGAAELFVHWHFISNSGDTLDWELLKGLSDLRLDLALDIYPEGDWLEGVSLDAAKESSQPQSGNGEGRSNGQA